ncbi:486_t:CDS:10 [Paraglomus occultum]|uniref:Vacuolar protein sorting-associated protein 54 n=1 Tax=Paraglomus occultum TaxID=144539 RepID=A0A9N9FDN3_9GLOM|nr:486_t:CDS:10 [Paraglomus occultum]
MEKTLQLEQYDPSPNDQDNFNSPKSPKSPKSPHSSFATTSPLARRFSTSSTRSFDNNGYHNGSPSTQRASSSMALYGQNYRHGHMRRISINSSISNFSTMSETSLPWTTKDIGFNAISGVLNNPNTKSSSTMKPTKSDIPPVPQTAIRKVKPSDFNNYLKNITPVFEKYRLNKEMGTENNRELVYTSGDSPAASATNLLATNLQNLSKTELDEIPAHRLESSRNPYSVPILLPSPTEDDVGKPEIELPLLETVPSIFFDADFSLEDPRTFDAVCEHADIIGGNLASPGISPNAILQEKLSHYLDTVEVHLINEISRRSSSFFAALSNLQALHSETLDCISQINVLRQKLSRIDESQAKQGLEVVRLKRRRANVGRLHEGIRMVAQLRSTQPTIQDLLRQGDYFSALDLIDEANNFLQGGDISQTEDYPKGDEPTTTRVMSRRLSEVAENLKRAGPIDLRGVRALVHFSAQLHELYRSIGVMMENDLLNIIFLDFEEHLNIVNTEQVINKLYKFNLAQQSQIRKTISIMSSDGTSLHKEEKLKERLAPLILGLYRTNRFANALQAYRERIFKEIEKVIQKRYPKVMEEQLGEIRGESNTSTSHSAMLAKHLKGMTYDAFLAVLLDLYAVLLEAMQRVAVYNELFASVLKEVRSADADPHFDTSEPNDNTVSSGATHSDEENQQVSHNETNGVGHKNDEEKADQPIPNLRILTAQSISGLKSFIRRASSSTSKQVSAASEPSQSTVDAASPSPQFDSSNTYGQLLTESSEIVVSSADLAYDRCAKLIAMRAEQNAQLNPKDFYRLFNVTWAFVLQGESLCGRTSVRLRPTIMSQAIIAKSFLNHFQMEKVRQLVTVIENEQWIPAEVPIDFQNIVNLIIRASSEGLDEFRDNFSGDPYEQSPLSPTYPAPRNVIRDGTGPNDAAPEANYASKKSLSVENNKFFVVGSTLVLLKTLGDSLRCMVNIPNLTQEVMNKIVEILNTFNSRTCQVILGGGARYSAGLKNITAKHLALASQSLDALTSLIPYMRECIRHNLDAKQIVMLTEFDRIKKDYTNHKNEIHAKLVSIMDERLEAHIKKFQAVQWDDPNGSNDVHQYMEVLVKETTTLHRVLNRYLRPDTLQSVMSEVFKLFNTKLAQEIDKLSIFTETGKSRLLKDVRYYIEKLSNLDRIEGPQNGLEAVALSLQLQDPLSANTL